MALGGFSFWVDRLKESICSHASIEWTGETHLYDPSRHRRTRWRSTVRGSCSSCGKPFAQGPRYEVTLDARGATPIVDIEPAVAIEVDMDVVHAIDVLTQRLHEAAETGCGDPEELLALSQKFRDLHPLLQVRRIARAKG